MPVKGNVGKPWTPKELAERWVVTRPTISRWLYVPTGDEPTPEGKVRGVRVGQRLFIAADEVARMESRYPLLIPERGSRRAKASGRTR